ncbi:insulinase family protein [Marinomonas sp. 15G1-11]|uniref:Insulinase family protein n=1 Tax=Marinomonas phaeophyticola TaxID=3004091 RepID=A0ABT4JTT7_9GAMM|nr:M16 family metallopeptidase [Marinomonas sp. 15G1-11]MCZ2721442.1 insulinase family protein [Marinomonas sp. 15G1-11]
MIHFSHALSYHFDHYSYSHSSSLAKKRDLVLFKGGWMLVLLLLTACTNSSNRVSVNTIPDVNSDIETFTLENGLDVILWRGGNQNAVFQLLIHSGSLQEEADQLGYAHFVEHMAFSQVTENGERPIQDKLAALELEFGKHANAYTYFDHTEYRLLVRQNDLTKSLQALALLTDFALNTEFNEEEVEKEKPVIIEEWRLKNVNNPSVYQQALNAKLSGSRYIKRFPIGTKDSINHATADALDAFYSRHYQADNATLIITGNIDRKALKAAIVDSFKNWRASGEGKSSRVDLPAIKNEGAEIYADDNINGYVLTRSHTFDQSFFNSELGMIKRDQIIALLDIFNDRIAHRLLETQGNVESIFANLTLDPLTYQSNLNFTAMSNFDGLPQASQIIAEEMSRIVKHGLHGKEWFGWRKRRFRDIEEDFRSSLYLASEASRYALNQGLLLDENSYIQLLKDAHFNTELVDFQQVAAKYFTLPSKIVLKHNKRQPAPSKSMLSNYFSRATDHIMPAKAVVSDTQWPLSKVAGSILKKTTLANDIIEYQLSNGLVVRFYETQQDLNNINLQLVGLGGLSEMPEDEVLAARLATAVMSASGLRNMTGAELKEWLIQAGIHLNAHFTFNSRELDMKSTQADLDVLLRLLHLALTEVKVDPKMFTYVQKLNIDQLQQLSNSPTNDFTLRVEEVLTNNDPAFRRMTSDEVMQIDEQRMSNIYDTYFKGTQNYVLTIVGDVSPDALEPLLVNFVANIPQTAAKRGPSRDNPIAPKSITVEGRGSNADATRVTIIKTLPKQAFLHKHHPDIHWIQRHFNKVLFHEIREEQGLVYSVNVVVDGESPSSVAYSLKVAFLTDPAKAKQVVDIINQELLKASKDAPTLAELNKTLIEQRQHYAQDLKNNNTLSRLLAGAEFQGIPIEYVFSAEDYIPEKDIQSTQALMAELLSGNSIDTTFILNP